jgi:nucleotide-binding universal stress UspA family protein
VSPPVKNILIATDGSDAAREAVSVGIRLALEQGAQATFLHVYPPPQAVALTPGFTEFPVEPIAIEVPPANEDPILAEAAAAAAKRSVGSEVRVTSGDAAWEVIAAADAVDADLIVLGSRGHGTVAGVFLGSVSHSVLRHTKRPVLVVHPPAS